MDVFSKSRMDSYGAGGCDLDFPCRVRIDDEMVVVEYDWENEIRMYRGSANGSGHYRLSAVGFLGEATLHRFPGASVIEGTWAEEGESGMWRIRLLNKEED